jgi:hypothetical protein
MGFGNKTAQKGRIKTVPQEPRIKTPPPSQKTE